MRRQKQNERDLQDRQPMKVAVDITAMRNSGRGHTAEQGVHLREQRISRCAGLPEDATDPLKETRCIAKEEERSDGNTRSSSKKCPMPT